GADDELPRLIPLVLDAMESTAASLNEWPVLDHGSAAFPDGHGTGIAAMELVATARGIPPLSGIVKTLSIPGFYGEAGPLAAAQIAQATVGAALSGSLSQMTSIYDKLPKAE